RRAPLAGAHPSDRHRAGRGAAPVGRALARGQTSGGDLAPMRSFDDVATELKTHPLVDWGLLKPGGRREVEAALARWAERGKRARIVCLPLRTSLAGWHRLWDAVGLDQDRDLLLLFNGQHWEARGWGLSEEENARALHGAESGLR